VPVLADLHSRLGANADPVAQWLADPSRTATATKDHCGQRWWGSAVGTRLMADLLDMVGPRDQARLLEQRSGLGSTWMTAPPSSASGAVFSSEEYCLGLRWWLGAPLIVDADARCGGCGQAVDREGDHFLCCPRNNFARRHDAVQDALFTVLSSTGQSVAREVALAASPDTHLRPADLLLQNWHGWQPTALDLTVVHEWPASAARAGAAHARDNWRPFLRRREEVKHAKYDDACRTEEWHFAAAAFGTWGGVGPRGCQIRRPDHEACHRLGVGG